MSDLSQREREAVINAVGAIPLGDADPALLSAVLKLRGEPNGSTPTARRSARVARNGARTDPEEVQRLATGALHVMREHSETPTADTPEDRPGEGLTEARLARMLNNADHRNANFQAAVSVLLGGEHFEQNGTWRQSPVYVLGERGNEEPQFATLARADTFGGEGGDLARSEEEAQT